MIKLLCGKNGTGKTKHLIEAANGFAMQEVGNVVFIDGSNELMLALNHKVRFINVSEFPINTASEFLGFISGIISKDYDVKLILIDGLENIIRECDDCINKVLNSIQVLSEKYDVEFQIGYNGEVEEESTPALKKEFVA